MPTHTAQQGDCLTSIAEQYGMYWETIWNHPENADLKRRRKDPNVLFPGDLVFVPEKRIKEVTRSSDQQHSFRRKGVPAKLRIRLMDGDEPMAARPYQLEIDGNWIKGTTDQDGYIEQPLPPGARKGRILVGEGSTQDVFELQFGTIDPLDTTEGVKGRLSDLGYASDGDPAEVLSAFQQKYGLAVTGQVDEATRQKLREVFGQ